MLEKIKKSLKASKDELQINFTTLNKVKSELEKGAKLDKVDLSEEELENRKKDWKPREHEYGSGEIWKYSQLVGPAVKGAVTHPGAKSEKQCYADI